MGFRSFAAEEQGVKQRIRSETFADHYSQARQFYISQTDIEQQHIADAFTFELSKVETPAIRSRMVAHLLNVDDALAKQVAKGLRLKQLPQAAPSAKPTRKDLKKSPALSILLNSKDSFEGRKLGILVTDGVDAKLLAALTKAATSAGAVVKLIAPQVGGVKASDGAWLEANEKIDGGPSVVFDAVALLVSTEGAQLLAKESTARDFVADAFAHMKFMAYTKAALPLLQKAGVAADLDAGCMELDKPTGAAAFIKACGKLRFWARADQVKQV